MLCFFGGIICRRSSFPNCSAYLSVPVFVIQSFYAIHRSALASIPYLLAPSTRSSPTLKMRSITFSAVRELSRLAMSAVQEGSIIFVVAGASHHFHSITADLTILVFFAPAEYTLATKSER